MSGGFGYLQYSHVDPRTGGPIMRVLPGVLAGRPADLCAIVAGPEAFYVLLPMLPWVVRDGWMTPVGACPVPEAARPFPLLRGEGLSDPRAPSRDWWLYDGKRSWRPVELPPGWERLSIDEYLSADIIEDRIVSGWRPEMDT